MNLLLSIPGTWFWVLLITIILGLGILIKSLFKRK